MNKMQREKAKRRKRLETIGIGSIGQKKFIKLFKNDFIKMDQAIENAEKTMRESQRNTSWLEVLAYILTEKFRKIFKK